MGRHGNYEHECDESCPTGKEAIGEDGMATIQEVLAAPDVSDWAKKILREAQKRDVVDALKDLELVHDVIYAHYRSMAETLEHHKWKRQSGKGA